MSKNINNNITISNNNLIENGYTISITNPLVSNILTISNRNNEEIMRISPDGELYYRFNNDMIKVEIPEDLVEAFSHVVLNYTGKTPDEVLIDRYVEKILNGQKSEEYISKLESTFRKLKLKKLNS